MNDILPKTTPASEIFNAIAKNAIQKPPDIIVNNDDGNADQEQIVIENWLAEKSSQNFLERLRKGNKRITLGYVVETKQRPSGQLQVNYVDQYGMQMGFVYNPENPVFSEAQNGFKEGDLIINEFQYGTVAEKIKHAKLSAEKEKKVLAKFKQIVEEEN